jgi:aryl-alcohol dehydrogenase-like predicted oxidoreductase
VEQGVTFFDAAEVYGPWADGRTPCSRSQRCKASTRGGGAPEQEILPTLVELGIGFVPFSPPLPLWHGKAR